MNATQQQLQDNAKKRREKRQTMNTGVAPTKPGGGGFVDALLPDQMVTGYDANNEKTNVSNVADEMMSKDNRLMQQAETRGLQSANRRGLMNSSMAVQASEAAVLDRVIPMASQESDQRFASRTAKQKFGFEAALAKQDSEIKQSLADQEIGGRMAIADQENEVRLALEKMNIASQNKQTASDMISTSQDLYAGNLRDIRNNTNLSAEERNSLISAEQDNISLQYQLVEDMYGIDIKWPGTSGNEAPTAAAQEPQSQQQAPAQPQPQTQAPQTQVQQNGAEIQWSALSGRPNENWDR